MADRSFGPTVLVGVLGAGLVAVTGHRPWLEVSATGTGGGQGAIDWFAQNNPGLGEMPAAGALGLVALASWGVVLVSRGTWRRVVAALGLVATMGVAATWVTGALTLRDDVEARVVSADLAAGWQLDWTSAFVLSGVAVLLLLPAHGVAVVRAPRWPAMSSRYDSPAARKDAAVAPTSPDDDEVDPADVWRAIDEGRDPTA